VKDETYQAAWKRFYVAKSRPDEGTGWLRGSNLVLMTSSGRLLQGDLKDRNELAQALQGVLDAYAQLPEGERRAKSVESEVKSQESPPADGLVLTIYDRPMGRDSEGQYRLPTQDDLGGLRSEAPHGQRSSLWLTKEECQSLIPNEPQKGQTYDVDAKLAKRIWLYGLVPQSLWVVEETWKPDSVKQGELQVTVDEVSPQTLRLRLHGSVLMTGPTVLHEWPSRKFIKNLTNRYDARLEGVLHFDRVQRQIKSFDLVALGDYSGRWFAGHKGWIEATPDAPLPLTFAFEIDDSAYKLPPERRRPRSFMHSYIFRDRDEQYWDPDKWLADWKRRQQ
jgi:hypothetical protein